MEQTIIKKLKSEKNYIIYLIVLAVAFACSIISTVIFLHTDYFTVNIIISTVLAMALWTSGVLYFGFYFDFKKSLKWLKEKGIEDIANDIDPKTPIAPKSKIYCGEKALFSKEPWVIIPYSEIAWTYMYERRTNGILVERSMIIHTKENVKDAFKADEVIFKFLLISHIIKNSPDVIVGYGAEQKAAYGKICPEYIEKPKRIKRIAGIALMCLGAVMLVAAIINFNPENIAAISIILALTLGGGLILFLMGSKK